MRHKRKGRKFGRETGQRKALLKGLASSLFLRGKIKTTTAKAKSLKPFAEKFITRAKNPTLANQRQIRCYFSQPVLKKILEQGKKFVNRPGGYARIIKLGQRDSDGAEMAIIEIVE